MRGADTSRIVLGEDYFRPGDVVTAGDFQYTILSLPKVQGRGYEYLARPHRWSFIRVWAREFWEDLRPVLYYGSGLSVLLCWLIMLVFGFFHRELAGGGNKIDIVLDLIAWSIGVWAHPWSRGVMRVIFGFDKAPWQRRT